MSKMEYLKRGTVASCAVLHIRLNQRFMGWLPASTVRYDSITSYSHFIYPNRDQPPRLYHAQCCYGFPVLAMFTTW